jgi:diguanylate cyclase (GGDEF)-like protein/PAS domain S-box-containing protein
VKRALASGLGAFCCVLSVAVAAPLSARLFVGLGWLVALGVWFAVFDPRSRGFFARAGIQQELHRKSEILRAIDANVPAIVYQRTGAYNNWVYQFVAGRTTEMLGLPVQEAFGPEGLDPSLYFNGDRERVAVSYAQAVKNGGGAWSEEFRTTPRDGKVRWLRAAVQIEVKNGRETSSIGVLLDITAERRERDRAQTAYDRDALTSLYSRDYFERAVALALERYASEKRLFTVVMFDIDDFHEVNDALGMAAGDCLLSLVADATLAAVPESASVARLGGDKFGVLAEVADTDAAPMLAERIVKALGRRFRVGTNEINVTVSAGCALPMGFRARATDLMHDAGSALERASTEGFGTFRLYADEMTVESVMRVTIKEALRDALERNEFTLVYQPKIDLASGRVAGCEALIRWRDPVLGVQSPAQFIPIAERSGLIVPIGDWVLREACRQYVEWQRAGIPAVPISVNVSAVQFARSDVYEAIAGAMAAAGAPPGAIDIEITESLLVDCSPELIGVLKKIRGLGAEISLDDFGTGFASISYLKRLPLSLLKIDQSFARGALNSTIDAAIVRSVVYLAAELGLRVIAEGAESAEQVAYLRAAGCQEIQGFFFSKPLLPDGFAEYIKAHGAAAARTAAKGA